MELVDVKSNKHAGKYAAFEGKTANQLYSNYKAWCKEQGVVTMKFAEWIEWAKNRGLIKEELNADALSSSDKEELKETINEVAADKVKDLRKKIVIVLCAAITIGIIVGIVNNMNQKTPGAI